MTAIGKLVAGAGLLAVLVTAPALAGRVTARGQSPEAETVTREAAGDDIRKEGPGKSPTEGAHGHQEHGDPSKHFNYFGGPTSHNGKDVVGGPYGDGRNFNPATGEQAPGEEEPMSAPFIFMILNFVVLLAILSKYGGPAAKKIAAERHDQIKTALDEAAKLRKQAADKLAEYDKRLKAADAEIAELVDRMREDAKAEAARIRERAEVQAAQMKRDAELRIAAEIELARAALTREVTAAAAAAAEKILREKVTAADQQKLVGAFIGELQGAPRKEAR
jgi:F-type H+-transporting ATPase subunit b